MLILSSAPWLVLGGGSVRGRRPSQVCGFSYVYRVLPEGWCPILMSR